jgi:hypothetical protein
MSLEAQNKELQIFFEPQKSKKVKKQMQKKQKSDI